MNDPKRECLFDCECAPLARYGGEVRCCHGSPRGDDRGAAFVFRLHTVNTLREVGRTVGAAQIQSAWMEEKASGRESNPHVARKEGIDTGAVDCSRGDDNDRERMTPQKIMEANRGIGGAAIGAHDYSKLLWTSGLFVTLYALYKLIYRPICDLTDKVKHSSINSDGIFWFHGLRGRPNVLALALSGGGKTEPKGKTHEER